jgi:hypothetical protein
MHHLLIVGAFLAFAFIAPVKVALLSGALLLLVIAVVMVSTAVVADVKPTFGEAFKAVGLSLFFAAIALFTLLSFSRGTGVSSFSGLSAVAVLGALLASYVLGFKVALRTSFASSALVALISTLASGVLLFAARSLGR